MEWKRHTPEEIISEPREAEVLIAQGRSAADAARAIGVTEQSYYHWRKEDGGGLAPIWTGHVGTS